MATSKIIELDETNTCKICDDALAIYSCPRCNIIYCSLECYRSKFHLECSEEFYKKNIFEELKLQSGSKDADNKILEILERSHENNRIIPENLDEYEIDPNLDLENCDLDSDDDEYHDLTDRLAGVNLDDAEQVWEKLTQDEKQDFVAFLKSEDVSKLISPWEPWWSHHDDEKIKDLSEIDNFKDKCPVICDIKDFSELTKKDPADCVQYNLMNILAAYVFTARYFNGEYFDFYQEAATCISSISLVLQKEQNFADFETAIKSVEQECINSDWIVTDQENIQMMKDDLTKVIKGPNSTQQNFYVLCALSDLRRLFQKASKPSNGTNGNFEQKFSNEHFPTVKVESPSKIKKYAKKVEYFLSYSKDRYKNFEAIS